MHFCSASLTQCTGARLQSRPRGENIIHNQDRFAGEAPARRDGAADIPATFRCRKSSLAFAALHPRKRARFPLLAAGCGERLREPGGLVEAAHGKARPVHRRWRDEISAFEALASGGGHPPGEDRQTIAAAATFQIEDEAARLVIVSQGGAGGIVGGFAAGAGAAHGSGAGVVRQRKAAVRAERLVEELQFAPKLRLDDAGTIDDGFGQKRARRPDQI